MARDARAFHPPANVRLRRGTAGVPPTSSRGIPPRGGARGELPPELAGEHACGTPDLGPPALSRPRSWTIWRSECRLRRAMAAVWSAVTGHRFRAGDLSPSQFRTRPITRARHRWREP